MSVKIEQLSGESVISITVSEPFDPEHEMPAMYAEIIQLRLAMQGDVVLIIDVSDTARHPDAFSRMIFALAKAAEGIRSSRSVGLDRPPILIFVGSGPVVDIMSQVMEQEQYGGVAGHLCTSRDEALALAREKLSKT